MGLEPFYIEFVGCMFVDFCLVKGSGKTRLRQRATVSNSIFS